MKQVFCFLMCVFFIPAMVAAKEVAFTWGASTGQVDGYRIMVGMAPGGPYPHLLIDVNGTETSCESYLDDGIECYLVCRAYNKYGEGGDSNEIHWKCELPGVPGSFDWDSIPEILSQVGADTMWLKFTAKKVEPCR